MKFAGIVAAMFVLVFGISMTSEANRRLVLKMWDGVLENFRLRVNTDNLGEGESVRSKSKEEIAALEDIREKLGGRMLDFGYLPKGMHFESYDIREDINEATIVYSYQNKFFYMTILDIGREGSTYYTYDEEAVFKETVMSDSKVEAEVWEVNLDFEEETYIAEMEYNGWRYVLNGMISLEEMRKILEYVVIF